jgi:hypothetical protein
MKLGMAVTALFFMFNLLPIEIAIWWWSRIYNYREHKK